MLTLILIASLALHALQFFLHGLSKLRHSKLVERVENVVDRGVLVVDGLADELEPEAKTNPKIEVAKATAPIVVLGILAGFAFMSSTAGCSQTAQQTTLKASVVSVDTAQAAWAAYDAQHMRDIVDQEVAMVKAGTKTKAQADIDATAELLAWHKFQAGVRLTIDTAYRAIGTYAATKDDPTSKQNLATAISLLQQELAQIGVK